MAIVYRVMLVQADDDRRRAELHEAPFASDDAETAKRFADAFNERELIDPLGLWAVVCREETQ